MGIKLIILLALLVGVLYSLHLLVQDYQALTAASKLLRFLFKRDLSAQNVTKPAVRWKRILRCDPIQCARYFYCELGARPANNEVLRGFGYMLTRGNCGEYILRLNCSELVSVYSLLLVRLEPTEEDRSAHAAFQEAYDHGHMFPDQCKQKYHMCPFNASILYEIIRFLLRHPQTY